MPRAWLLLVVALSLVGCGPKLLHLGGKFPKNFYNNQISISPSTTEILAIQGSSQHLKGRDASSNYPSNIASLPVFATVKPDYEKLKEAGPDLVVLDSDLYSPAEIAKLESELGKDKVFIFRHASIDDFETSLKEYGLKSSLPMAMSSYIDKIDNERTLAKTSAPANPPSVAVVSGTLIGGTKGFLADVIKTAGGKPVGAEGDRFAQLNPEALVQSDPDIILLGVDLTSADEDKDKMNAIKQKAANAFAADPRFRTLKAVKTLQIYPMNADVLLRAGGRVDTLISEVSHRIAMWSARK